MIVVVFASVAVDNNGGQSTPDRTARYEIYRTSGTPAQITEAQCGRTTDTAGTVTQALPISDSLFLMGTEVPGAGTHTYELRHKVISQNLQKSYIYGNTLGEAMMAILEVKP